MPDKDVFGHIVVSKGFGIFFLETKLRQETGFRSKPCGFCTFAAERCAANMLNFEYNNVSENCGMAYFMTRNSSLTCNAKPAISVANSRLGANITSHASTFPFFPTFGASTHAPPTSPAKLFCSLIGLALLKFVLFLLKLRYCFSFNVHGLCLR